jgi:hypothetical protein
MPTLVPSDPGHTNAFGDDPIDDVDGMLAATTLLQHPRLARSYVYIAYYGPVTIQDLIDDLDVPRATAYDDVETLESMELVARDSSSRPHELTAVAFVFSDERNVIITPTILHAVALSQIDEEVDAFHSRYGVTTLVHAVHAVGEYYAGDLTQRMVATEIDVPPAEGMAIVYALEPALAAGTQHDPYFDRLFPDIHDEIDSDNIPDTPDGEQPE